MNVKCTLLHSEDNVCILTTAEAKKGQDVGTSGPIKAKEDIPLLHKMAVRKINRNEAVIKFSQVIGISKKNILPGEHVHVHNVKFSKDIRFSEKEFKKTSQPGGKDTLPVSFKGYLRDDGQAGTRNYITVVATVNCSATVVKEVTAHFKKKNLSKYNIDGIVPVVHMSGCAQSKGYGYSLLNRTLAGWLDHPNVVGSVIIGLGCEMVTTSSILQSPAQKKKFGKRNLEYLSIQECGGTAKAVKQGIKKVEAVLAKMPKFKRVDLPVSLLKVALKCGGSDALSSITANPALGLASDILVSHGGSVVLGEIPECYGAESYLQGRCRSNEDKKKIRDIFSWWDDYAAKNKVTMNDNMSPGNIAGGISTILEKSLGAIAKGGTTPVNQVVDYAEPVTKKGLAIMNTPGFDPVAATGLVAGGCNLLAFTTGRGSVYGCSIAPTIKISSNTDLFNRLKGDIDIDAGNVLNGSSLSEAGKDIYRLYIKIAGGFKSCSEINGLGNEEFAPWLVGETL